MPAAQLPPRPLLPAHIDHEETVTERLYGLERGIRVGLCCAVLCCAVLCCALVWCSAVQCGVVWRGAVRCDAVRCGAVYEEGADTEQYHIHRGQDQSENGTPTGLRIDLQGSLALCCTAFSKCCAMQCPTSRQTDSKASWGPMQDLSWPWCRWSCSVPAPSSYTAPHRTTPHRTTPHHTTPHCTGPHRTTAQHSTAQHNPTHPVQVLVHLPNRRVTSARMLVHASSA